jgi:hypothetical protein
MMLIQKTFICLVLFSILLGQSVFAADTDDDSFTVRLQYGEDTTPPSVPDPVVVTPVAPTQIDVTWGASVDADTAVAGYQLFRDSVQIATTSLLSYSDIGLTPSTTYAYSVTAFDIFGNFSAQSAPVATTTPDLPPPPPVATSTPSQPSTGSEIRFRVNDFTVTPSTNGARLSWRTNIAATFTLRYGASSAYDDGIIQSNRYATNQETVISSLEAGTTYYYELYATDSFGREHVVRKGTFTTLAGADTAPPPNVGNFIADAIGGDVLLSWQNPVVSDFAYVRVIRNHLFYPVDVADGFVVYEGPAASFTDAGALAVYSRQFYTIFAYDTSGNFSSGAIAVAVRASGEVIDGGPDLPQPPTEPAGEGGGLTPVQFLDIIIEQDGKRVVPSDGLITIDTTGAFTLKVPYERFPQNLKVITVTLSHPDNPRNVFSFLLRADETFSYYTATIDTIAEPGVYGLSMTVFDVTAEALTTVSGNLRVEVGDEVVHIPVSLMSNTMKVFLLFILFILILVLIHWQRRRRVLRV